VFHCTANVYFYSVYFTMQGSQRGKLRTKFWKNCNTLCFWQWLIFKIGV